MKAITQFTDSDKYGITVNKSFVLSPSKSIGFIIGADVGKNNNIEHNCSHCPNLKCKWRNENDKDKCFKG